MALVCEDLSLYGVVLLPPGGTHYQELFEDIERRLRRLSPGSPLTHANLPILINQSGKTIVSLAYSWKLIDNFGMPQQHERLPQELNPVLLPFDVGSPSDWTRKMRSYYVYAHTVFATSKRLVTYREGLRGDNSDVRPPNEDEIWKGGWIRGSGGDDYPVELKKLTLDGVFFSDGGFVGPNQLRSWERVTFARETCLECSAMAAQAQQTASPASFFEQLEEFLGRGGMERRRQLTRELRLAHDKQKTLELIRQIVKTTVHTQISSMRNNLDDKTVISVLAGWEKAPVPQLHML